MTALALPLLPLLGAALLIGTRRRPSMHLAITLGTLLGTLALGIFAALMEPTVGWRWSALIELRLAVDGFGRVMVVLVPVIAAPIVAYAAVTERDGRTRLLALMLAFVGAMLLLVSAADFVSLLMAWELVGFVSWALIGHGWRDPDNPRAATQAFITTRLGDLGLYAAAGLTFAAVGGFAFEDLASVSRPALDLIAAGVVLAAAAKSAQVPFAPWLFAAMAGPTPVSALLHSATLVAAGAYLLIRLAPSFESVPWFGPLVVGIGLTTAVAGGLVAVLHGHAKRLLAGSTSAQYGLMFVAVGAGSTAAAGAQLVAHAAFKSLLFLGAGVAIHAAGTAHLASLRVGGRLRLVAGLSAVGALALAAVPPLGGAWTKEQVVAAAAHASPWLALAVLGSGFLTALYAARYQLLAFGRPSGGSRPAAVDPPPATVVAAMAALAAISLALGLLWLPGAATTAGRLIGDTPAPSAPWEFALGLVLTAAAFAVAWWLQNRGRLAGLGLPERWRRPAANWLGLPGATERLVVEPLLAASGALATFDNRVVDAGVRRVARLAALASDLLSRGGEWTIDGTVRRVADGTLRLARGSRIADERGVDAAIEGTARGIGLAGSGSRRLQTGQAHHYYVVLAAGLAAMAIVLVFVR